MKKAIKLGTLAIAATLVMSALTGCSGGGADSNKTTAPSKADNAGTTESKADNTTVADNSSSGKSPKLLWWQIGSTPQDSQMVLDEMNKYTKDKIGVEVDVKYVDWGEWSQKISTIINSGEAYDIMFTDSAFYSNTVNLGGFADITDVIDSQGPKLKELIPDIVWSGVTIKDRIYAIPTYKDSSQVQSYVFDKEIVDSLGIDVTTVKELKDLDPILRKMKENIPADYPNQYPLYCSTEGINSWPLGYEAIGGVKAIGVDYDDKEGKVVNVWEQPEIMEELKYIHSWYQDGIINPDAPTLKEAPKRRMVYSAQGFPGADEIWSAKNGYQVVSTPIFGPVYSTPTIQGSLNAISSSSKYANEAVKYLELVNTDATLRNLFAYGIEGTHYNKTAEGTVDYLNDTYRPALYSQATFFTLMAVSPSAPNTYDLVREQNERATASSILGFVFDPSNVETEIANIKNEDDRYRVEIATGARDPEEAVAEFNKALYDAGLQTVIDEAQRQVNEFLGK